MTADELAALPDDGKRHELLEGELLTMPPASDGQGIVAAEITGLLRDADREKKRGRVLTADVGFKLEVDPDTVLAPDVSFVLNEKVRPAEQRRGFPPIAPDLVVEILSPSNTAAEMNRKVDRYLRAGASMVWLVDPENRTVTAYEHGRETRFLSETDEIDGGDILPDFRVRVADFFA